MRIAVVDDEKNWLVKIKRYIKEYFGEMMEDAEGKWIGGICDKMSVFGDKRYC